MSNQQLLSNVTKIQENISQNKAKLKEIQDEFSKLNHKQKQTSEINSNLKLKIANFTAQNDYLEKEIKNVQQFKIIAQLHQIFAFEPEYALDEVKSKWNELVPLNVLMMISDGIFEFNPDLNVTKIIDYDTYEGQNKQVS